VPIFRATLLICTTVVQSRQRTVLFQTVVITRIYCYVLEWRGSDLDLSLIRLAHVRLHWLRAPERILYRMAVLTCKALHVGSGSPRYLSSLVHVADMSGRPALRSAGSNRLRIPPFKLCQPSAIERFRSRQHSSGTCCRQCHASQFVVGLSRFRN